MRALPLYGLLTPYVHPHTLNTGLPYPLPYPPTPAISSSISLTSPARSYAPFALPPIHSQPPPVCTSPPQTPAPWLCYETCTLHASTHLPIRQLSVLYKETWWRSGNQALYSFPSQLSIWASPDLVTSLTHDRGYSSDRLLATIAHYPTPFAPMPTRYADYNSHTLVGSTHDPSHWLLATDRSVARHMTPDGASIRRMAAGVVLVRPANASWAECPMTTDA